MTTAPRPTRQVQPRPDGPAASPLPDLFGAQQARRWALAQTSAAQRVQTLRRLGAALTERRAGLAAAVRADLGKSRAEFEITELNPLRAEIRYARLRLAGWMRPRRVATPLTLTGSRSWTQAVPRGTSLILSPWNYPVNLALTPLVSAIAAGNTAVLKPSEKTPRTSAALRELIAQTFDPAEVALVEGGAEVAQALLELPFDHFFFTGGATVGRKVMAAAAQHLAGVTLELGGKSPAIVERSADLALAAERLAWGKYLNAGQTCVAPDYLLVPEELHDRFVLALDALIFKRFGSETWQRRGPDYGRMVDAASVDRLERLTQGSVAAGARVAVGGTFDRAARFISPTVVTGVTPDMPLMQEELFGPVLPVLPYRTLDEALALVRRLDPPLALYLFTQDPQARRQVEARTTSGSVMLNGCVANFINPNLPFGGVGVSGLGSYHGHAGFRAFSHERATMTEPPLSAVRLTYPPYGRVAPRFAAWLMRTLSR